MIPFEVRIHSFKRVKYPFELGITFPKLTVLLGTVDLSAKILFAYQIVGGFMQLFKKVLKLSITTFVMPSNCRVFHNC